MREITKATSNITNKDKFNMKMCNPLKDLAGSTVELAKAAIGKDVSSESGEVVETGVIITADGTVYGTISRTAIDLIDAIIDLHEDEPDSTMNIRIVTRKSNANRDYLVLEIAD